MRSFIRIALASLLCIAVLTGCAADPSGSPSLEGTPTAVPTTTPTPVKPDNSDMADWSNGQFNQLEGIVIYDTDNYLSSWDGAAIVTLAECGLKIDAKIAPVNSEVFRINQYDALYSQEQRDMYYSSLLSVFADPNTMPDFLPALYALNTGKDAVFKKLGPDYLIDFNPFISAGGILEDYVNWVWGEKIGDTEYFYEMKEALLAPDGCLYALPRAEYMMEKSALIFNHEKLDELGLEVPKTWEQVEEALAAYKQKNPDNYGFIHNMETVTLDSIITPVANAYGLDFDTAFDWKEMNGKPLFSYYDDAYLKVLQAVKRLAENEYVITDPKYEGTIAGWDCSNDIREILKGELADQRWSLACDELMMYGDAWHRYHLGVGDEGYWIDKPIAAEGYKAALSAGSGFDYCYIAISNRSVISRTEMGYDIPLRIMNYMSKFCNLKGYLQTIFGREGIPFAESWEESGNFVWTEGPDGKEYIRFTNGQDRFNMRDEDLDAPFWKAGKPFFEKLSPLYTWLFQVCNGFKSGDGVWRSPYGFDKYWTPELTYEELDITKPEWIAGEQWTMETVENYDGTTSQVRARVKNWSYYMDENHSPYVTDDHIFPYPATEKTRLWILNGGRTGGIDFFADVSAFPMQYTIYNFPESQTQQHPIMDVLVENTKKNGMVIYELFAPSAFEVMQKAEAEAMEAKIAQLSALAKDFTREYLRGRKSDSDWEAYKKSLENAGYNDVYKFYTTYTKVWATK